MIEGGKETSFYLLMLNLKQFFCLVSANIAKWKLSNAEETERDR